MIKKALPLFWLWSGIFAVWFLYRYLTANSEWMDEFIFKPLIFVAPVIFYLHKKHQLVAAALGFNRASLSQIIGWGFGLGLLVVGESLFLSWIRGQALNLQFFSVWGLFSNMAISAATAANEEILYRGFLMGQFIKVIKNVSVANVFSAVLFTLAHVPIAWFGLRMAVGEIASYLFLVFVLGIIDGYIFQKTRTVSASIITHALWNFSSTLFR